jgi:CheY-like chemotaxis protein
MKYSNERIVLYIDDDTDDCDFFSEILKETKPDIQLIVANNGRQAIRVLHETKKQEIPCLIVLETDMPQMDGKRIFKEVRTDETLSEIPIVVFTNSSNKEDINFWEERGITVITKPITATDFRKVVTEMIDRCINN